MMKLHIMILAAALFVCPAMAKNDASEKQTQRHFWNGYSPHFDSQKCPHCDFTDIDNDLFKRVMHLIDSHEAQVEATLYNNPEGPGTFRPKITIKIMYQIPKESGSVER